MNLEEIQFTFRTAKDSSKIRVWLDMGVTEKQSFFLMQSRAMKRMQVI